MDVNNSSYENELNISDNNCSYCNDPFTEELWCKDCDIFRLIEGWTSENSDIDKFIKDTIYNARHQNSRKFLEWVPFERFLNIKQIGEGGFAKVYTAIWRDGSLNERLEEHDGSWKKLSPKPIKVALKRLNGSQNMSAEYLSEVYKFFFFVLIF